MKRAMLVATLAIVLLPGPAGGLANAQGVAAATSGLKIDVLSNRADLISGGDALVAITPVDATRVKKVLVTLNGSDVTSAFALRPNGRYEGLVTGLRLGDNLLIARRPGSKAEIRISNHPIGGPVFAGAQTQPWICATQANGLGPPQDTECNVPARYSFQYKSAITGQFAAYDTANPPSDVAVTVTDQGMMVPYIVRVESGVIDRGIYAIAVLHNPSQPWAPWQPQRGFNGKLVVPFGGDCKPWHKQGAPSSVMDDAALSRGFGVLNSNLNILGQDCNDVVSAEALMMLKEHFVEAYGPVRYTIGNGCSGGSMQQHWIASNYPGLLQGIQPSCSYPDIWETMQEAEDCHLLDRVFDQTSPALWLVTAQRTAVEGYALETTCRSFWDDPTGNVAYARTWLDPDNAAACSLDPSVVYNAQTNPTGVRCTLQDYGVSIWGRRAADGFANRPFDNVGVQYGLNALESGEIIPEQFVDLNHKIGGLDIDWNWQPQRSEADPAALEIAYLSGRVTYPREAAKVPIVDLRGSSNLEIHTDFHSYVMRQRLIQANGNFDNQIIWTSAVPLFGDPAATSQSFLLVDQWLAGIEADASSDPLEVKVVRNKPAGAVDACWIGGRKITDQAICRVAFPYFADPRIAAGGPFADNILKCQLKPLRQADYSVTFTDDQWARLQDAFPTGVCDYNRPGVGQQPSIPWLTYANRPGGQPLGSPPQSTP